MARVLQEVTATGGFLENCRITLTAGLNCIIGSRGTCKSTVVESVRFAFDAGAERIAEISREAKGGLDAGVVAATLGSGCVRCTVRDGATDETFTVERELGAGPRVFREGVQETIDGAFRHRLEIYSQGELQRIAEDPELALALVDRPHMDRVIRLQKQGEDTARQLKIIGEEIRLLRTRKAQLDAETRRLPELRQRLSALQQNRPTLSVELERSRSEHLRRQGVKRAGDDGASALRGAITQLDALAAPLDALRDVWRRLNDRGVPESAALRDLIKQAGERLKEALDLSKKLRDLPLDAELTALDAAFQRLDGTYFKLRQDEQQANEVIKQEDVIKREIETLEGLELEGERNRERLDALTQRRGKLRGELADAADELYGLRQAEVEKINAGHGQIVLLTLRCGGRNDRYRASLERLLDKSRLRNRDELATVIAGALPPADLIDLVESGDSLKLAAALGREPAFGARLLSLLMDSSSLYELEGDPPMDLLEITLYDDGVAKPVGSLSKGQKATALLPLILRPGDDPLIFDQPEDDLDNRFIFASLVKKIGELKKTRQLVFVTHNANIPVIGDAENVVVMRMENPKRAAAALTGTVDDRQHEIIALLEGGEEAFRQRQSKYHLTSAPEAGHAG